MPVVFSNPLYPYQYAWSGAQASSTQLNYGRMLRQVTAWNPDLDPETAGRMINDALREVVDKRLWYGLKLRGQISIAPVVSNGQATVTNNSNLVQGFGTTWDQTLIGLQFRVGFTYPWQSIIDVDPVNQVLTLDTLYGGQTILAGGYQIVEVYITLGGNIKYLLWAVNQQQGWPMEVNSDVRITNSWDSWRQSLGWSTMLGIRAPTPDGQIVYEVWPAPYGNQVFPFEAYQQPPDMELDSDSPPPWIRSDVLVARAIAEAKVICGRQSKWYDPVVSQMKMKEFATKLEDMENADNNMDQQDVTWDYGEETGRVGFGPGSTWMQSHDG